MQKRKKEEDVQVKTGLRNSKQRDSSAKIIFDDPILCSQFLRDYTKLPLLNNVQPEDIEDVTERFVHMFTEERNSDVVKRIHLKNENASFYLISLIEHKSRVDYNVVMQILRYIVFIWEDYEKEMEREKEGISKTKSFKYPPILPIIYYTGNGNWSGTNGLDERVYLSDILKEYIPNFKCIFVKLRDYTNAELMEKHDELSLIMMINKLQKTIDFKKWKEEVDLDELKVITEKTPSYLLGIMAHMIELLLLNINVPSDEAENIAETIKERDMAGLFDHFEKIDIQEARRIAREEGHAEGHAEGMEEGRRAFLIELIAVKIKKGKTKLQIAEELEITEEEVEQLSKE